MKRYVFGSIAMLLLAPAMADDNSSAQIRGYAQMLKTGAFYCELKNGTYQTAVGYRSDRQDALRSELMACLGEYSGKARAGLPAAVKAAKSESVRTAVKNLHTEWTAYFGEFDPEGERRFERANSALDTELLTAQ